MIAPRSRNLALALALVLALAAIPAHGAEPTIDELRAWISLGAAAQNASAEFETCARIESAPDPASFELYIAKIEKSLKALVANKALARTVFELKPPERWPESGLDPVDDFTDRYADEYGYGTAQQLVGLGVKMRLSAYPKGKAVELVTHLPAKDVKAFRAMLAKAGLLEPRE